MATREKTGGRAKGVPNKITLSVRETFKNIIESEQTRSKLDKELSLLTGKDYIYAICKLAEFVVPKKLELSGDEEKPLVVKIDLRPTDLESDSLQ